MWLGLALAVGGLDLRGSPLDGGAHVEPRAGGLREIGASPARTNLKVFIYDLAGTYEDPCQAPLACQNNFAFEYELARLFGAHASRTRVPAEADLFYVPAPLVNLYMHARVGAECTACAAAEQRVLRRMEEVQVAGQSAWRREQGADHIVHSLRCPHTEMPHDTYGIQSQSFYNAFPALWGGGAIHLCLEETSREEQNRARAIKVPYYTASPAPPQQERRLLAYFYGSLKQSAREYLRPAFAACADCQLDAFGPAQSAAQDLEAWKAYDLAHDAHDVGARVQAKMAGAVFAFEPRGDTAERHGIIDSVFAGAIPVVDADCQMPFEAYLPPFFVRESATWQSDPSRVHTDLQQISTERRKKLQDGVRLASEAYTYSEEGVLRFIFKELDRVTQ